VIADLRTIDLRTVRQLRHELLRPHQQPWEIVFEGDDEADTLHVGAFREEVLVGIASVMREPPPGQEDPLAWRLRGMATLPEMRGQGYGGALLERCLRHATDHGGDLAWCTARVPAAGFYRRYGFENVGEVFDVPSIGPHIVMTRRLG
jgi:predicted GNAT family N-acyltransferase